MTAGAKLLRAAPKRDRESDREEYRQTMELIAAKCLEFGVEGAVDALNLEFLFLGQLQ